MDVIEKLIDRFFTDIFRPEDRLLVDFIFREEHTQSNVDALLKGWDIEVAGGYKALALSYVAKRHPELNFSTYTGPRLSGMWTRIRFENLRLMAHFNKVVKALNAVGIRPMVVKGGAIKILNPSRPRIMGDVDLVVRDGEYDQAREIVRGLGYVEKGIPTQHSVDFVEPETGTGVVDIHRWIDLDVDYAHAPFMEDLFRRARVASVQGGEVLLPSAEDHFFILMMNLSKNISHKQTVHGVLNAFFDSEVLVGDHVDFDWRQVFADVEKTHAEAVYFATISFVKRLAPSLLPDAALGDAKTERRLRQCAMQLYFWRYWKLPTWQVFRRISLKRALFGRQSLKLWLSVVPYYCVLKLIDGRPLLVSAFLRFSAKRGWMKCA